MGGTTTFVLPHHTALSCDTLQLIVGISTVDCRLKNALCAHFDFINIKTLLRPVFSKLRLKRFLQITIKVSVATL